MHLSLSLSLSLSLTVALRVGCKSRSMNFFAIKRAIPSPSFFESECRFYDMFHKDMGHPPSYKPLQQSKRAGGRLASCRAVRFFNWVAASSKESQITIIGIWMGIPTNRKWEPQDQDDGNFLGQNQLNRLQMVQLECPKYRNPCVASILGWIPFSHFPLSLG